jgi:uncharacterized protein YceH (UPF0502 family)
LRQLSLVVESSGGRVMRYAQNVARVLEVPSEAVALLATLMLRGPQTPGEIRINCERMHRFSDISSVEAYLRELAARPAGALAVELPRMAGSREARWMHLLSGAAATAAITAPVPDEVTDRSELATIRQNVDVLGRELADVKLELARVMEALGIRRG